MHHFPEDDYQSNKNGKEALQIWHVNSPISYKCFKTFQKIN